MNVNKESNKQKENKILERMLEVKKTLSVPFLNTTKIHLLNGFPKIRKAFLNVILKKI